MARVSMIRIRSYCAAPSVAMLSEERSCECDAFIPVPHVRPCASDDAGVVSQWVRATEPVRRRITLVLDGNHRVLRDRAAFFLAGLAVEDAVPVDLWLALERPVHHAFATPREARTFLAAAVEAGEVSDSSGAALPIQRRAGFDNGPALASTLAEAGNRPGGGVVIWVCGPQISSASSGDAVRQVLERARQPVELRVIAILPGRHDLIEALDGRPKVRSVVGFSAEALQGELRRAGGASVALVERSVAQAAKVPEMAAVAPTPHLARLWASEQVSRLLALGPARRAEATALAVRHQLVTSVSGAVVFEAQAQYDAHGPTPVDPASVPTVPETASVIVVVIAAMAIAGAASVRRRWARAEQCR